MGIQGLTRHAMVRMQQRGIGEQTIDDLLAYGRPMHDHHGAEIIFFDKAAKRRLAEEQGGRLDERLTKLTRTYAVFADDGSVRTVGWRYKRIRRH